MELFDQLPITAQEFAIGFTIAVIGSIIQGSIGFGLAVVSAPTLLLVNESFVPGSLLVSAMLLSTMMIFRERHGVVMDEVVFSSIGRLFTTIPAAFLVASLPKVWFNTVFAVAVLLAVLMSLRGWHLRMSRTNVAIAGAISGLTGTISSIGGPPMAIVYQHQQGPHLRATLSAIFTIGTILSMISLWFWDKFHWHDVVLGISLMPGVLVGFALSSLVARRIDGRSTRPAVLFVSALSAIVILAKTWLVSSS